ncbi:MAG: TrbI/VirB10 family protein [Opitutaceae bacterium]|nr:TrbI/VirB10 family protein [Opitutaceae bacterium]
MPKTYQDIPKLGAPLPGELGRAVLNQERAAGITEPLPVQNTYLPFQHNPEVDQARAERLRRAQIAEAARESKVFFQISDTGRKVQTSSDSLGNKNVFLSSSLQETTSDLSGGQGLNSPSEKKSFLEVKPDGNIYNPYRLQDPLSRYQVMAGSVIAASLITGINSDLPGVIFAQVTEPVYDTVTGQHILIPQGSRLIGKYDSEIAEGQGRILVIWQRIIMPNGSSIEIDNLPAADTEGYAGLSDKTDYHTSSLFKAAALSTLLNVGTELAFNNASSDLVRAFERSTQDTIGRTGQKIVDRNLNIKPTNIVRPGWPVRVLVSKDIILRPYRA